MRFIEAWQCIIFSGFEFILRLTFFKWAEGSFTFCICLPYRGSLSVNQVYMWISNVDAQLGSSINKSWCSSFNKAGLPWNNFFVICRRRCILYLLYWFTLSRLLSLTDIIGQLWSILKRTEFSNMWHRGWMSFSSLYRWWPSGKLYWLRYRWGHHGWPSISDLFLH